MIIDFIVLSLQLYTCIRAVMKKNNIFRQESLDRLDSPELLSARIKVTTPSMYVILVTLAILVAAVVAWGILGSITDKSTIGGVVYPTKGTVAGTIPNSKTDIVNTMIAFAPFQVARKLREGMEVEVTPMYLTREKDGYVRGRVTYISKYPITKNHAARKLHIESFATGVFPDQQGNVYEFEIELNITPQHKLEWSFDPEEEIDMSTGTFCNVQIITKSRSVYEYMFESVRKPLHNN